MAIRMRAIADSSQKAFTLIELMIVIVIVGVVATLAIGQFLGPKEEALDKEARANLKLIAAAEKVYRMEVGWYVSANNETIINKWLRLSLPQNAATKNWQYDVSNSSDGKSFIANATRTKGTNIRTYNITQVAQ